MTSKTGFGKFAANCLGIAMILGFFFFAPFLSAVLLGFSVDAQLVKNCLVPPGIILVGIAILTCFMPGDGSGW